ncbi:helix-turn-helix domain-containing protein [Stenotrophomonas maltophilia]|uniref:helix-turn-helix domain-containing protein n=1 Tax=Stenotrophomonas maltophilia TaxID=40324 RepID=UPI001F38B050|nr:helix-turn-helix transcriptional regulator [Stenotrophomonas maltophilia]MCF3528045.1 helix-turn-helix domain-containing protein [Stenotrophomonas maltophilia]MCF3531929.1 helix-turn-helix domain-containing protein [Stenotrophomonas maltophilia]
MSKSIHRKEYAALIEAVRDARLAAGLTQVQVSRKLGRSQSFISDVETGKRRIDVVELRDIALLAGLSLGTLIADFERRLND